MTPGSTRSPSGTPTDCQRWPSPSPTPVPQLLADQGDEPVVGGTLTGLTTSPGP